MLDLKASLVPTPTKSRSTVTPKILSAATVMIQLITSNTLSSMVRKLWSLSTLSSRALELVEMLVMALTLVLGTAEMPVTMVATEETLEETLGGMQAVTLVETLVVTREEMPVALLAGTLASPEETVETAVVTTAFPEPTTATTEMLETRGMLEATSEATSNKVATLEMLASLRMVISAKGSQPVIGKPLYFD
jgi:hypothetical protein